MSKRTRARWAASLGLLAATLGSLAIWVDDTGTLAQHFVWQSIIVGLAATVAFMTAID